MADWPTEPADIVREALRDYVGDGEGADEAVLAAYEAEIRERIAQEIEAEGERMILASDAWTRGEERHLDALGLAASIARGETR